MIDAKAVDEFKDVMPGDAATFLYCAYRGLWAHARSSGALFKRSLAIVAFVLAAAAANAQPNQALVNRYCVTCHNQRLKTAKLELDTLDLTHPEKDALVWERAIRKLRGGMMPPPGAARPPAADVQALAAYLETTLDKAGAANPNPGSVRIHRLNRAEYSNAMRDLFGLRRGRVDAAAQRRHQRRLRQHRQRVEGVALVPRSIHHGGSRDGEAGRRHALRERTAKRRCAAWIRDLPLPPGARAGVTGNVPRALRRRLRDSAQRASPRCSPSTGGWSTPLAARI